MVATNVWIYPAFNARYYSIYIDGLQRLFGPGSLHYTTRGFPRFESDCLAFRVGGTTTAHFYLHSNDMPELHPEGLRWCDVFGKVNLDPNLVPEPHREKVIPLGPMFPVRVWDRAAAEYRALMNYVLSKWATETLRRHVANYRGQYRSRFPENEYRPGTSDPDYLFFNAAVWEREAQANTIRSRFVQAALRVESLEFEGGLTPRRSLHGDDSFDTSEFTPYISRRYSPREYLAKTKQSIVVLNNPAYRDCHSWRLAEGLALGKAIISTPIVRALPSPLEHGVHIHYVDGSVESFESAIRHIRSDGEYRSNLEFEARRYYEEYLSPENVMKRILGHAEISVSDHSSPEMHA